MRSGITCTGFDLHHADCLPNVLYMQTTTLRSRGVTHGGPLSCTARSGRRLKIDERKHNSAIKCEHSRTRATALSDISRCHDRLMHVLNVNWACLGGERARARGRGFLSGGGVMHVLVMCLCGDLHGGSV